MARIQTEAIKVRIFKGPAALRMARQLTGSGCGSYGLVDDGHFLHVNKCHHASGWYHLYTPYLGFSLAVTAVILEGIDVFAVLYGIVSKG